MKYLNRSLETKVKEYSDFYKIILVTGARQAGKSTMLSKLYPNYKHITFDPVQDLYGAREDPDLFLDNFPPPIILDEVQYVPGLLAALKRRVDQNDLSGGYMLTGSQNLSVIRSIAESMAGRVGILKLDNMSPLEISGEGLDKTNWLQKWIHTPEKINHDLPLLEIEPNLAKFLWRGTMPALLDAPDSVIANYYSSYVQTYIERDIRTMDNIRDLSDFGRFIRIAAALTAQEINASQLGREIGISPETAKRWLNLLSYGFQWIELAPYFGNALKRISKKRKGYFTDTGLICYLQSINSPDALAANPIFGALFETFAVNLISKQLARFSEAATMYHWRLAAGAEVDVIVDINGKLYPIEIKAKSRLNGHDTKGIRAFINTYPDKSAPGIIFYAGKTCYRVNEFCTAIPWLAK